MFKINFQAGKAIKAPVRAANIIQSKNIFEISKVRIIFNYSTHINALLKRISHEFLSSSLKLPAFCLTIYNQLRSRGQQKK